jgi:hypothetical protein
MSATRCLSFEPSSRSAVVIYTDCIRRGIFHLRLKFAPDDFLLLSPSDPAADDSGMTLYMTNGKKSNWWFCKTCGVRCFTIRGETEHAEVEVETKSIRELGIGTVAAEDNGVTKVKAWKLKKKGYAEVPDGDNYFSVNAVTVNPKQNGLDLREWHERRWIAYVDSLERKESFKVGSPHVGGIY